jgi:hypothetical protein
MPGCTKSFWVARAADFGHAHLQHLWFDGEELYFKQAAARQSP